MRRVRSMREGSMREGSMRKGSMRKGSVRKESMRKGSHPGRLSIQGKYILKIYKILRVRP